MASESLLNNYYNRGGYNQPSRIGFMMKMIRNLKPLTQEEWEIWYLENVHDEEYLDGLAQEMCDFIPDQYHVSFRFLYKGIIIKHNKTEPTYTKTSLFLCEKRRFFMARTEKGVVTTI